MNWVDVVIPTRNRAAKLLRTLGSIPRQIGDVKINVIVGFDCDPKTAGRFEEFSRIKESILFPNHVGSIAIRNEIIATRCDDAVLYATDDIIFQNGAIASAVASMKRLFPDDDGVVGFKVVGDRAQSKAGVGLVGSRFLQRYPGKTLFHPGYFHFGAQEIERAAKILHRLFFDERATIVHFHPAFYPDEIDRTHLDARKARKVDLELSRARQRAGLTWGING